MLGATSPSCGAFVSDLPDLLPTLRYALAGRYAVERELGRGGMATVFLAEDLKHHRPVAIKVLHQELAAALGADRFLREIEIAARLQHPHILPLYDSGRADGLLFYVMPYVEGESLRDRLEREKQLSLEDALKITAEVANALAYAHSHGVVHRDIKPENIMLSGGNAVVADFGIARAISAADPQHLTQTGTVIGTPAYMSPEQATGSGEIDGRSDQYSLACVTYEMLVGQPPFTGPTARAIMARHSLDSVSPPSIVRATIPDGMEDAILRALAKTPADRFPTTALFAESLQRPSPATGPVHRVTRPTPLPRRWLGLPPRAAIALGVAVLIMGFFGARSVRQGGRTAAGAEGLNPRHIAVLYFEDLSHDKSLAYLADGITETLIGDLARVQPLTVVSRNGVAPYRDGAIALDSIGRALGAGTLVRGSIEDAGDKLHVNVRLVDGASGVDFKRASFEQQTGDLLRIRDSVAQRVAEFLRERLGEEVRLRQERVGTNNVAAWSLLERAEKARKDGEAQILADSVERAFASFQRADSLAQAAGALDEKWVDAPLFRGQIAYRRAKIARDRRDLSQWVGVALGEAEQALRLAPQEPRALELRGSVRYLSWLQQLTPDPKQAVQLLADARQDLERATELDPTLASGFSTLSHLYYQTEDVPAALLAARKAYEQDAYLAVAADVLSRLFVGSYDLEQFTQAQRWCLEGNRRFPRDYRFVECRVLLMTTDVATPDAAEAWRLLARLDSTTPSPRRVAEHHRAQMFVGAVLARAGLKDSASHVLVAARAGGEVDPHQELLSLEAFARTLLGEPGEAIALLTRYVAANPTHAFKRGGDVFWWWRDLRKDPRFAQLERARP